ncbi:di-trans,poly-cis-decaprenylcistransferase [bacterium]|nr:MAG: di-trans,poly-cis-decaprenylcistransferase [bacterium]
MEIPKHVAIIPDGNRRWAREKKAPEFFGHREGAKNGEKILEAALELNIPYLTFWGLSLDNVQKRSLREINLLFSVFEKHFRKLLTDKNIAKNDVRIDFLGKWRDIFPTNLKKVMEEVIQKTKGHKRHHLTFLMAYNGYDEMLEAIEKLKSGKNSKIDYETVKKSIWTHALPPVDLVIRTGGEPHWSNGFMMWDAGDAQLYFTETLWPDFGKKDFRKAIEGFSEKNRRFGQ